MSINLIGSFGYLSKAHIQQEVLNNSQISQIEIVDTKIANEKTMIADFDTQISQIDAIISKTTQSGKSSTALAQINSEKKSRDDLVNKKLQHLAIVNDLTKERLTEEASNDKLKADFGPLLYIADAIYGNPNQAQLENVVRWIITLIQIAFDPLAIFLLISAQIVLRKKLTPSSEESIYVIDDTKLK